MAASLIAIITVSLAGFAFGFDPTYNSASEICCAGVTHSLSLGTTVCCGNKAYNPNTQMCCDGAVVDRYENGDKNKQLQCCGQQAVTPSMNKVCCSGQMVDAPSTESTSYTDMLAVLLAAYTRTGAGFATIYGCCQWQAYNMLTQTCCNGAVTTINGPNTACCAGAGLYNPNLQACCNGRIATLPDGTNYKAYRCCDFEPYNPAVQVCCPQDTLNADRNRGLLLYKSTTKQTDCANCDFQCCGAKLYKTVEEVCCMGVVTPLDPTKKEYIEALANGKMYRNSSAQCCDQGLNKGLITDTKLEMCCLYSGRKSKIGAPNADTSSLCCGDDAYNPLNQICCNNKVVDSPFSKKMGCCMGMPYQLAVSICCRGQLVPRTGAKDSCCE